MPKKPYDEFNGQTTKYNAEAIGTHRRH